MKPKIIKTTAEYEAALARVDALMSATPGTPEGEELELWVHLVEAYEDTRFPIAPPEPIEAIRFRMEQQGFKPADLIPYLGSKSRVSEVLSGRRSLSLSMIRKLHDGLGIPSDVLLRDASGKPASPHRIHWDAFPLAEMVRRRWFGDAFKSVRDLRDRAERVLSPYFAPIATAPPETVHLRQGGRRRGVVDENALYAWKARVWHLAQQQRAVPYAASTVTRQFIGEVARLSPLDNGPVVALDILAKTGIRVVIEPQMPRTYLDGAAIRSNGSAPILALTLRYDRLDNFWFTLCHELAHVALHLQGEQGGSFVDDLDVTDESPPERQADNAAARAMVGESEWKTFRQRVTPSRDEVIRFAASMRVHPAIIAGRYRKETKNFRIFSDLVGHRRVRAMFAQPGE
jgi:HTH-type transcriptional regulator / antitoxin HigA